MALVLESETVVWERIPTPERVLAVRRVVAGAIALAITAAVALLLVRPAGGDDGPARAAPAVPVDPELARVATARLPLVDVYRGPSGPIERGIQSPAQGAVLMTLEHPTPAGGPLVFLVEAEWEGWYRVRVPSPPAGTTGWVRASDVEVAEHRVHVVIDLDDHLLVVYDGGEVALRAPVALGVHDRPEPGRTYVTDRITLAGGHTGYGARVLPLAGYANGRETVFRGRGMVALHETGDGLGLGQTVTSGSVGLARNDMEALFELVPLGAPVDVAGARSSSL